MKKKGDAYIFQLYLNGEKDKDIIDFLNHETNACASVRIAIRLLMNGASYSPRVEDNSSAQDDFMGNLDRMDD